MTSFECPHCEYVTRDPELAALGWCERCGASTGTCPVGWHPLVPPVTGLISLSEWHLHCRQHGEVPYVITMPGACPPLRRRLCRPHDGQVRAGRSPWTPGDLTRGAMTPQAAWDEIALLLTAEYAGWTVTHGVKGLVATSMGRPVLRSGVPAGMRAMLDGERLAQA